MIQAAKIIGIGLASTGLIGAGAAIGIDSLFIFFQDHLFAVTIIVTLGISGIVLYLYGEPEEPMSGMRCPVCARNGRETWVIPGKNCHICGHSC